MRCCSYHHHQELVQLLCNVARVPHPGSPAHCVSCCCSRLRCVLHVVLASRWRALPVEMPDDTIKVYPMVVATACEGRLELIRLPLQLEKDLASYKRQLDPVTKKPKYQLQGLVYDDQTLAMMDANHSNLFISSWLPAGVEKLVRRLGTQPLGIRQGYSDRRQAVQ